MKKLLVFALFLSATAHAGRMDEIVIMTQESIAQTLNLAGGLEHTIQFVSQDFVKANPYRDLAVETKVLVTNVPTIQKHEWTCVTQFVKTPKFFEVSETNCN